MTYEITFAKDNKYIKMIRLQNINLTPPEDIEQLANNHAIAVNLRDNTFVGCCSLIPQYSVYRINAEIGYWVEEPY